VGRLAVRRRSCDSGLRRGMINEESTSPWVVGCSESGRRVCAFSTPISTSRAAKAPQTPAFTVASRPSSPRWPSSSCWSPFREHHWASFAPAAMRHPLRMRMVLVRGVLGHPTDTTRLSTDLNTSATVFTTSWKMYIPQKRHGMSGWNYMPPFERLFP
jgi:hypothetical protein